MAGSVCPHTVGRRVAVVEDDHSMALLLAYNLEAAGHLVSTTTSGSNAIRDLEHARPELVILDWQLPGLSGIEILRQLRRRLAPDYVPVVMLTGRNGIDDRRRAREAGADVFLSKPFAMSELLHHVETLLDSQALLGTRHRS